MRGQQHKRHLTKLVYDMLPPATYKQKNRGQTWLPVTCRHCTTTTQPETFDHLLRCHHPHAADTFRSGLIAAITKHCTHRSIPRAFTTRFQNDRHDFVTWLVHRRQSSRIAGNQRPTWPTYCFKRNNKSDGISSYAVSLPNPGKRISQTNGVKYPTSPTLISVLTTSFQH
jgi:hypothetical protein